MNFQDFADWKHLRTMGIIGIGSLFVTVALMVLSNTEQIGEISANMLEHEQWANGSIVVANSERQQIQQDVSKLLGLYAKDRIRSLTVQGKGVPGTFGTNEGYIRINRQSLRVQFNDGERVKVMVLSQGRIGSVVLPINGTFFDTNSDLLVIFSAKAADDLDVRTMVDVKLEPLKEE